MSLHLQYFDSDLIFYLKDKIFKLNTEEISIKFYFKEVLLISVAFLLILIFTPLKKEELAQESNKL